MADMIESSQWDTIFGLVGWIDAAEGGRNPQGEAMRVLKLAEEVGEVASAYFGMKGQNPRKGQTHTREDVCGELADVILSAAIALATLADRDPAAILNAKIAAVANRSQKFPAPRS
jgi:NTP pyrophosphatase (non-canonical NTP hydrolase)